MPNTGRSCSSWLPRACGDRPYLIVAGIRNDLVAPRMRGSTLRQEREQARLAGCPAHAGIDPLPTPAIKAPARLPRACGDRPSERISISRAHLVAPRMRGSTVVLLRQVRDCCGCPAHAGIDPEKLPWHVKRPRLPRACGDRPRSPRASRSAQRVAPRMRGSTQEGHPGVLRGAGCPAHAGIDPTYRCPGPSWAWLPRACGDRPRHEHQAADH